MSYLKSLSQVTWRLRPDPSDGAAPPETGPKTALKLAPRVKTWTFCPVSIIDNVPQAIYINTEAELLHIYMADMSASDS